MINNCKPQQEANTLIAVRNPQKRRRYWGMQVCEKRAPLPLNWGGPLRNQQQYKLDFHYALCLLTETSKEMPKA